MEESQVPIKKTGYKVKNLKEVNLKKIMDRAYYGHIVVPAFNVPYLPMIKPVVDML